MILYQISETRKIFDGAVDESWILGALVLLVILVISSLVSVVIYLKTSNRKEIQIKDDNLNTLRREYSDRNDKQYNNLINLTEKTLTTLQGMKDFVREVGNKNEATANTISNAVQRYSSEVTTAMLEIKTNLMVIKEQTKS